MRKIFGLAMVAALFAGAVFGVSNSGSAVAQEKGKMPASEPYRPRIALVNIAKVLKDYDKANAQGKAISDKRQGYLNSVNALRMKMTEKNKELAAQADPLKKDAIAKQMTALTRDIEDLDATAQKQLGEMSNETVVSVYKEIKETIAAIAEANGLELVMAYPDASEAKDMDSPVVAQLKLQTPALMPFYHKGIDITGYVVTTLNQRYPAPKGTAGAAIIADPNVKTTGGK